jgi:hypothetical protein
MSITSFSKVVFKQIKKMIDDKTVYIADGNLCVIDLTPLSETVSVHKDKIVCLVELDSKRVLDSLTESFPTMEDGSIWSTYTEVSWLSIINMVLKNMTSISSLFGKRTHIVVDVYQDYLVEQETGKIMFDRDDILLCHLRHFSYTWCIKYFPEFRATFCLRHFKSVCVSKKSNTQSGPYYSYTDTLHEIQTKINQKIVERNAYLYDHKHRLNCPFRENLNYQCYNYEPRRDITHIILSLFLIEDCTSIILTYLQ